jgi:alpha-L-fucosidase
MSENEQDYLAWWREVRFGMFIHWGIYSVPAGVWKGQPVPSLGEWIMHNGKIPFEEYSQLAKEFNPVKFNAEEWVAVAKAAGMKYLVITAKHHDGFAMFNSPSNPYNIVDATPYKHDVMKDLAEACHKAGIRMCFYYSQDQDWAWPGASGHWEEMGDKGWWGYKPDPEGFAKYLEDKVKPQLRELLTQYGPIGLIWFDTPVAITLEQSLMLKAFVHELQPECLVSGRVGNGVGDYGSLGDNQIPCGPVVGEWETPATLNDTWGYKSDDHNWKTVADLIYLLVDLASKGVNYLLNVGPTSEGLIPPESVDLLLGVGKWMDVNSDAIYGTQQNPYPYSFEWGRMTTKDNRLFLLFTEWPAKFSLPGLRNNVRRVSLLADPRADLTFRQQHDAGADSHLLEIDLPKTAPDSVVSVVVVEFEGTLNVDTTPQQQISGKVVLPAYLAEIAKSADSALKVTDAGWVNGWTDDSSHLSWKFKVDRPGRFLVRVVQGMNRNLDPATGHHTVAVAVAGAQVAGVLTNAEPLVLPRTQYFPEYASELGEVSLSAAGEYELSLSLEQLSADYADFTVAAVELAPVGD